MPNNEGRDPRDRKKNDKKEVEEEKPALRYGKIPKEILETYPWFDEYDLDKDGQVALWEWRKSGGSMSEFITMDLNGDGLITADELVRWKMKNELESKEAAIMAGERPKAPVDKEKKGGPGGPRGNKPLNAGDGNGPEKNKDDKTDADKSADRSEKPKGPPKDNPFMNGGRTDDKTSPPRRKN